MRLGDLPRSSMVFGVLPDTACTQSGLALADGDRLLFFTDAILDSVPTFTGRRFEDDATLIVVGVG